MRRPNGDSQSPQLSTEGWNKLGHDPSTPNNVHESLAIIECNKWGGNWYGKLHVLYAKRMVDFRCNESSTSSESKDTTGSDWEAEEEED